MNHERRPDVVYYNSEENTRFSDALAESIVIPAYFAAIHQAAEAGVDDDTITADCECYYEENRMEYDFFAQKGEKIIYITSTLHEIVRDLSFAGALLIDKEIQYSTIHEDIKDRWQGKAGELYIAGKVGTFTRRIFRIEVNDEIVIVRVHTSLGYSVDDVEITPSAIDVGPVTELDLQFEKSFEREDIHEIVRALLAMELIEEGDVKRFLDQEF